MLGCGVYVLHLLLTGWGLNYGVVPPPAGWTTLVLLVLFFGGVQCLFLGILGEYLAQVQIETKARPSWIVAQAEGVAVENQRL